LAFRQFLSGGIVVIYLEPRPIPSERIAGALPKKALGGAQTYAAQIIVHLATSYSVPPFCQRFFELAEIAAQNELMSLARFKICRRLYELWLRLCRTGV
jgi:hypothetical protein